MALSVTEQEAITARVTKLRNDLVEQFFTAFGNAGVKFDAEGIQRQIVNDLTKERRNLALKMLGFDDRWGKIEIDHSNGRKSVASDFISQNVGPAVQKWVDECLRPAIEVRSRDKLNSPAVMKAIMKDFDSDFMYAARKQMEQLAEQAGEEFANTLADQIKAGMKLAQD
jgi:hypothetical protein